MAAARKSTQSVVTLPELSEAAAEAWRVYDRERKRCARLREAEKRMADARAELDRAFGAAPWGILPDGTILQRSEQRREFRPLPAKVSVWNEYRAVEPW